MEGMKPAFLDGISTISIQIGKLGDLVDEVRNAESTVQDLVTDLKETVQQLANLKDFINRSNLSAGYRDDCERSLHGLGVEINRLKNLIDSLFIKIHQQNPILRATCRFHFTRGGYNKQVREQILRTHQKMTVIRQEMSLDTSLNRQQSSQNQLQIATEARRTDASNIRREYSRFAREVTIEERRMTYVVPQTPRSSENSAVEERRSSRIATICFREVCAQGMESMSPELISELEAPSICAWESVCSRIFQGDTPCEEP
ncbi:hypothetical protein TWF696_009007 [Orbilia brochopaga]|uniref:Uncharacterized protein n=1 Tax=Orbilia brochopaga TaxID=3140254 RepID=A0AAV9UJE2_9PEZI